MTLNFTSVANQMLEATVTGTVPDVEPPNTLEKEVALRPMHYVLRGGVSEKCCNLQNPIITSCQLGQVKICSTVRDIICHISRPCYCYFMAFFPSNPNGMNIG